MNNQAEVAVAMQGIDDVMKEMWRAIAENDARMSAERVEATFVLAVLESHQNLIKALKLLRSTYQLYGEPVPKAANEMNESDLGIDFGPSIEQLNKSND